MGDVFCQSVRSLCITMKCLLLNIIMLVKAYGVDGCNVKISYLFHAKPIFSNDCTIVMLINFVSVYVTKLENLNFI